VDDLAWLEQWYRNQCDGDWEEQRGVSVESLDNPGWSLHVDLAGTSLEPRALDGIHRFDGEPPTDMAGEPVLVGEPGKAYKSSGANWMIVGIHQKKFLAAGDPARLRELIRAFRDWASS
jgi:hypothetical protein